MGFLFFSDLAAPDIVKFGIESKFSSPFTSTEKFKEAITEAMEEMYFMCEAAQKEGGGFTFSSPKSPLVSYLIIHLHRIMNNSQLN